jgi:hypothetical protein
MAKAGIVGEDGIRRIDNDTARLRVPKPHWRTWRGARLLASNPALVQSS